MSEREQLARLTTAFVAEWHGGRTEPCDSCARYVENSVWPVLLAAGFRYAPTVLREAADEFDKYDEVTIEEVEVGSNMVPVPPADRLRARADDIEAGVSVETQTTKGDADGEHGDGALRP